MTDAIPISWLNDYIFDPKSIYFHNVLEEFEKSNYHQKPQINGNLSHESIDKDQYSNAKRYLVGKAVYCEEFNLTGKIDIYDKLTKTLVERKHKIHQVYQGQIYQLYAQYYALLEEGFEITKLKIYSMSDNKNYLIPLPTQDQKIEFTKFINKLKNDSIFHGEMSQAKNDTSIYSDYYF
jgi:CRISPR-associated exonuclease Cas4